MPSHPLFSGRVDWIRTSDPLTPSQRTKTKTSNLPAVLLPRSMRLYPIFTHVLPLLMDAYGLPGLNIRFWNISTVF